MSRQLRREEHAVGWVRALPVELAAARETLDEEHHDLERNPADSDENLYALALMGGHSVAIACLPASCISNNSAAAVVKQMRTTFKAIRFGLMVGIGGGVWLGGVVVSQPHQAFGGVLQYEVRRVTLSRFEPTASLNSPAYVLLSAVANVRVKELRGKSKLALGARL
jgi:hypothetical protein